ncbi:MAG: oligosaccharide flippase family protein [Acidobacteriota bacterium]|nr:oligosaccharide flippase family protein [Acidobacteriota bacterium]
MMKVADPNPRETEAGIAHVGCVTQVSDLFSESRPEACVTRAWLRFSVATFVDTARVTNVPAPAVALSLRQNFAWTTAGNFVYAGCQWAIVWLFAKLGNPEMVGHYALGLAVTAPLLMLGQLNLRAVLATDVSREHAVRDYCGLRLSVTALSLLAIAAICYAAGYPRELSLVILAVGVAQSVEGVSDIYYGVLQLQERMERIAISMAARGTASVIAIGCGIYFTHSVLYSILALIAVRLLVLVLYDSRQALTDLPGATARVPGTFAFHARNQLHLVWVALPLGVVLMLGALSSNTPRYFIEHDFGSRELGIFSAIASLINVGKTLVNALGQAGMPRLAKLFARGELRPFAIMAGQLVGTGAAVGAGGVAIAAMFGRQLLTVVFKSEYAPYSTLLIALMISGAFDNVASLLGYTITAARSFRLQMPLLIAVAGVTVLTSFLLIPSQGLSGAALAVGAGAIVQIFGSLLILGHAMRDHAA